MNERIAAAAIRLHDGRVYSEDRPARHHTILHNLYRKGFEIGASDEGFVTTAGRFVDREEALKIATAAEQLNDLRSKPNSYKGPELFSEDLW